MGAAKSKSGSWKLWLLVMVVVGGAIWWCLQDGTGLSCLPSPIREKCSAWFGKVFGASPAKSATVAEAQLPDQPDDEPGQPDEEPAPVANESAPVYDPTKVVVSTKPTEPPPLVQVVEEVVKNSERNVAATTPPSQTEYQTQADVQPMANQDRRVKVVLTDGDRIVVSYPQGRRTIAVPRKFSYRGAGLKRPFWLYDRKLSGEQMERMAQQQKLAYDKWWVLHEEALRQDREKR